MKPKNNEKLFKILISLAGIFALIFCIFSYFAQANDYSKIYSNIAIIVLIIDVALCIYIFSIMGNVKITYKNLKSERFKINYKKYSDFENYIRNVIANNGYSDFKYLGVDKTFKMKYATKKRFQNVDMILLIQVDVFDEAMLQKYFDKPLNNIIEEKEEISNVTTNLIYIICANKSSKILEKITEENVVHGYYKFNLPTAITFDTQTLYIAPQKSEIAINKYKYLLKQFKSMFGEILNNKEGEK